MEDAFLKAKPMFMCCESNKVLNCFRACRSEETKDDFSCGFSINVYIEVNLVGNFGARSGGSNGCEDSKGKKPSEEFHDALNRSSAMFAGGKTFGDQ